MSEEGSNIVYHYCSPKVFQSTIEKKEVWLCDVRKSNDSAEIDYVLDAILSKTKLDNFADILDQEAAQRVSSYITHRIRFYKKCCYWLAICFSREKDDLGQWRAYGADGAGFAIGFDTSELQGFTSHYAIHFGDIRYGDKAKEKYVDGVISNLHRALYECLQRNSICSKNGLNDKGIKILNSWCNSIAKGICFYKGEKYSAEQECRLCYARTVLDEDLEILSNPEVKAESLLHNVAFAMKNNGMTMHLREAITKDMVREIVIGPKCNVTDGEMKIFLAINGWGDRNIKISRSCVTYRG